MRVKKERFALKMKDNVEVRSLEEFREHFELGRLLDYAGDGTLLKWLELWRYADEADALRALDKSDYAYRDKLCTILGVNAEEVKWRHERLQRLQRYTSDPKILQNVDNVAFDTEELYDILDEGVKDIYLCNNEFRFPSGVLREKNRHYHGVGEVKVIIESDSVINFSFLGITFDNIKFDDKHKSLENKPTPVSEMTISDILQAAYNAYKSNKYLEAMELYKKASESGNLTAMCMVGDLYFTGGYGVGRDNDEARKWYGKAARAGDERAAEKLKKWF